jgi:hypothetical protein
MTAHLRSSITSFLFSIHPGKAAGTLAFSDTADPFFVKVEELRPRGEQKAPAAIAFASSADTVLSAFVSSSALFLRVCRGYT